MARSFPALDESAEAALWAGARSGPSARRQAFDGLFRALREPVLALCLHLTGRRSDAEDALQETFLSAYRALPFFRGEARFSTWVYRIALRAALRVRSRRRPGEQLHDEIPGGGGEAAMAARDEVRQVAAAMARLPAEQRAVLSLFAVEGLSHAQIAQVLGVPEGTIWSRLHAARKRLAAEMGGEGG